MADITVRIEDNGVLNLLSLMKKRSLNMSTPYRQASFIAHSDVIERFSGERDEKGQPWKPLSPATIKARMRRKRKSRSVGILKDTGRLRQSIRPSSNRFGAEVKTNVEYAATQNYGDRKRNIPARPFMKALSNESTEKIIRLFQVHLFINRD